MGAAFVLERGRGVHMIDDRMQKTYGEWCRLAVEDQDVAQELEQMGQDPKALEDAFYKELSFGTGGLRGVIGAGPNQLNIYTIGKASQGLARYIVDHFPREQWSIAVSYDSRIKSDGFAKRAAEVFAAAGLQVHLYPELMPTPCLSFAVRHLQCAAGVMVTASHNPSKYNGYKVYGADGCQITSAAAKAIYKEIQAVDTFAGVERVPFEEALADGRIAYIDATVEDAFIEAVKEQSLLTKWEGRTEKAMEAAAGLDKSVAGKVNKDVAIIYSPLNGSGLKPVMRTLQECGYSNITVVKEQEQPDGHFPTCPKPNPEVREAMALGLEYARRYGADLLLATDPDCDRVGIAVKDDQGEYVLLSGDETGMLVLDYLCRMRTLLGCMPEDPVAIKTIVTIDMAERIAAHYGVRTINVLTGFKYIGEQIGLLEQAGKLDSFVFGLEESYGYLSGTYSRDKCGVVASLLICDMYAWYQSQGISLYQRLQQIYAQYGYCCKTQHSYTFEGAAGFAKMQEIMARIRQDGERCNDMVDGKCMATDMGDVVEGGNLVIGGKRVLQCLDYSQGLDGLPPSNVLKFYLEDNCSIVVRPSGTEPKLKLYFSVCGEDQSAAVALEQEMAAQMKEYMQ